MLCAFHKSILNCYPLHHCHNKLLRVHVYRCNYNVLSLHVCVLQKHVQVFWLYTNHGHHTCVTRAPVSTPPSFTGCHGTVEGSRREGSGSAAQGLGAECGGDDLHEHTTTTASPLRQQDCHQGNTPCCYGGSPPPPFLLHDGEFTSSEEGKHSDSSSEVCVAQTKVFIVWNVREECSNTSNGV